jgi:hypothetical protein
MIVHYTFRKDASRTKAVHPGTKTAGATSFRQRSGVGSKVRLRRTSVASAIDQPALLQHQ